MPIKYRVLPNQNLLFGVFSGMLTPSEYLRGIEELSGNPEFKSNFAFEDIIKIKEKMAAAYYKGKLPDGPGGALYRLAAVLDSEMHQMMIKLYGATLSSGMPLPIIVESFSSLDDALIWLERDDLAAEMRNDDWQAFMTPDA